MVCADGRRVAGRRVAGRRVVRDERHAQTGDPSPGDAAGPKGLVVDGRVRTVPLEILAAGDKEPTYGVRPPPITLSSLAAAGPPHTALGGRRMCVGPGGGGRGLTVGGRE